MNSGLHFEDPRLVVLWISHQGVDIEESLCVGPLPLSLLPCLGVFFLRVDKNLRHHGITSWMFIHHKSPSIHIYIFISSMINDINAHIHPLPCFTKERGRDVWKNLPVRFPVRMHGVGTRTHGRTSPRFPWTGSYWGAGSHREIELHGHPRNRTESLVPNKIRFCDAAMPTYINMYSYNRCKYIHILYLHCII